MSAVLIELLYDDDLIMMNRTVAGFRTDFGKWKGTFESKGFMDDLRKKWRSSKTLQKVGCLCVAIAYV